MKHIENMQRVRYKRLFQLMPLEMTQKQNKPFYY